MSSRGLFSPVDAAVAPSSLVPFDCFAMGLEIVEKLCLVLNVPWCLRRNLRLVFGCSIVGGVLPVRDASPTSSSQHSSLQTIASCGLRGKGSTGCKQLACQTILHLVHSVSVLLGHIQYTDRSYLHPSIAVNSEDSRERLYDWCDRALPSSFLDVAGSVPPVPAGGGKGGYGLV